MKTPEKKSFNAGLTGENNTICDINAQLKAKDEEIKKIKESNSNLLGATICLTVLLAAAVGYICVQKSK